MQIVLTTSAKMNLPPLILASASPRRAELLRELAVDFQVVVSRVNETRGEQLSPQEAARINAYRKARAVAKRFPDSLVLGADTLVCLGHRIFGKPLDRPEATQMLEELKGQTHEVVTAICLLHLREHRQKIFTENTSVTLHPLSSRQIRNYLSKINPLDKAGAYAVQEYGDMIVQEVSGSFSNVVGLPIEALKGQLGRWERGG